MPFIRVNCFLSKLFYRSAPPILSCRYLCIATDSFGDDSEHDMMTEAACKIRLPSAERTNLTSRCARCVSSKQAEDDMIFTVNHMLRYLEESEKLTGRK